MATYQNLPSMSANATAMPTPTSAPTPTASTSASGAATEGDDLDTESVEVLRARLNHMKRLMAERTSQQKHTPATTEEIWSTRRHTSTGVIDGNFLSFAFGGALMVIISVSIYAFYNLYHAILKKFPSNHEEL